MFDKISWIVCFIGVVSAVCIIANIAEAQVATNGLVSYWSLDAIKDNTIEDVWGENDGTIFGNPKIAEGKIGTALNGDDHIVCGDDPSILLVDTDFSVSLWFNADIVTENIYLISTYSTQNGKWYLLNVSGGNLIFAIDDDVTKTEIGSPLNAGQWYHAVGVREKGNEIRLYVNGVLEASAADQTEEIDSDSPVYIGDRLAGARAFKGSIDEIAIYNRVLSENEITQNYKNDKGFAVVSFIGKLSEAWGRIKVNSTR